MVKEGYKYYGEARFFYDMDDFESCYATEEDYHYWEWGSRMNFEYVVGVVFATVDENDVYNVINNNSDGPIKIHNVIKIGVANPTDGYVTVKIKSEDKVYAFKPGQKNLIDIYNDKDLCLKLTLGETVYVEHGKLYSRI
jgi:hypothetical protein